MNPHTLVTAGMIVMSVLFFTLAWLIGVAGNANLISNYRAHPERYPDVEGLTRWMGLTLAAGGLSFGTCALVYGSASLGEDGLAAWCFATGIGLCALALGGIARYRRVPRDKRG